MIVFFAILSVLIIISGCFSAAETAMMAINRYRLRHQAHMGNKTAKKIQTLLERPDRLLTVILIGNTLANICASSLATILAMHLFGNMGVAIATGVLTLIILVFSETLPKTIAALHPRVVAFTFVWPLSLLLYLCYPLVWLMNRMVAVILSLFHLKVGKKNIDHLNTEELRLLIYESSGMLSAQYRKMLLGLFDLEKVTVKDIMLPCDEISAINLDDDWDSIFQLLINNDREFIAVYRQNINQIVGILNTRSLFRLLTTQTPDKKQLLRYLLPPYFIPEQTHLNAQLANFQKKHCHCALVVNEYGYVQGLVTLNDILEEIVGDFVFDINSLNYDIHKIDEGRFVIDGSANIRDINKALGWHLPSHGPKTLSGLIIEHLEMIPKSELGLKINDYYLEIIGIRHNRIKTVQVTLINK